MNNMFDNDLFRWFDALANYTGDSICNKGLKDIIKKPHNLYSVFDDDGNIVKQVFEVVYTPFSKNDIDVHTDGEYLLIKIGNENEPAIDDKHVNMIYKGISGHSSMFKLLLNDNVDKTGITAKADDGILRIIIPFRKRIEEKPQRIEIQ